MPSRKSYTAAFKLEVIQFAEEARNRPAERKFGVAEKMVRYWRKQKDSLSLCKKTKRANRGLKPGWAALEDRLEEWVLEQHAACCGVSTTQISLKAQSMATEDGIDSFQGGPSWCLCFMRRKGLSVRARTTVRQQLPGDAAEKIDRFLAFIRAWDTEANHIINMDEVPLTFDLPMTHTVDRRGISTVSIKTTGHEKTHFTVVLAFTASRQKLPPVTIGHQGLSYFAMVRMVVYFCRTNVVCLSIPVTQTLCACLFISVTQRWEVYFCYIGQVLP